MTLIERAVEIATNDHRGQTRWDGSPYVYHPIAVMYLVKDSWLTEPFAQWAIPISMVGAVFHDIAEDTKKTELDLVRQLEDEGYLEPGSIHSHELLKVLKLLNKNNYSSYLEFILAVKGNWIAKRIKIADITHNLSDLKDKKMRDKYLLALHILQSP